MHVTYNYVTNILLFLCMLHQVEALCFLAVRLSTRLFVHYQACKRDILKTNELVLISAHWHQWSIGLGYECQKVKGQGHMSPKIDLELG